MSNTIHRLIYHSKNTIRDDRVDVEIAVILNASRTRNARCGITGALMYNRGIFAQVIEGPLDHLESAFERIQRDPRHISVEVLDVQKIERRGFPDWTMGYVGRDTPASQVFLIDSFMPKRIIGQRTFATLERIARADAKARHDLSERQLGTW